MILETETAGWKSGLSQAKLTLLDRCLRGKARPAPSASPISRRGGSPAAPLSFAQERIWFFSQLAPESPLYNLPVALRVRGRLRVQALQAAIEAIVARHEILRTRFVAEEGIPSQRVKPAARDHLTIIDLSRDRKREREATLQKMVRHECCRPFDLSRDPMLRSFLIRLDESDHVLLLVAHHIAMDAWSWRVFFRELAGFYDAVGSGMPAPGLPIQYADFAIWQRERLRGEAMAAELAYWKRTLADSPTLLELPTDCQRPSRLTFGGGCVQRHLPDGLGDSLGALGRREEATLFMTLMAAFKVFLHRQTGAVDIVVGTPVAGRNRMETEGLIGFFVNTLPVRSDLSGDPSFETVLRRVKEAILGAFSHQDLPFEKLVEELRLPRNPHHAPLVNVLFVFQDGREPLSQPVGLSFDPMDVETETAKFDISFYLIQKDSGLSASLEYNSDLFARATAERMLASWETLLGRIVADPTRRISELPAGDETGGDAQILRRAPAGVPSVERRRGEAIATESDGGAPNGEEEIRLESIWKSVLGVASVGATDNFFEVGGHSLLAVRLVAQIETAFGRRLPVSAVYQAPSIRQLARLLDSRGADTIEDSPLMAMRPRGSRPPLFLVHGIGGGMLWGYSNLTRHLNPDQPVFAFKSRASDGRRDEFESIEEMAGHYLQALRQRQPTGPYLLGGYCFGGNVAFEMARQLQAQGQEIGLLALFNSSPPNCSFDRCSWTPAQTTKFIFNLFLWMTEFRRWDPEQRRQFARWKIRTLVRKLAALRRLRIRAGKEPDPDTLVDLQSFPGEQRNILATHVGALCRYESRSFDGRVTLFRTRGYPLNCSFDYRYGWGEFARGGVVVRMIPGTHESILDEPQVRWVARSVDECIEEIGMNGG